MEDSPTQALRLRHALEQRQCAVQTAGNGAAALEALQAAHEAGQPPPDVIVSDILMPQVGGYELCRKLKGDPRWAGIPLVLLTALGDPTDLIRGLECGADSFVVKPCEVDHLLTQIIRLLRDRESAATMPRSGDGPNFCFAGECYRITATVPQVLRFLIASYEEARHRAERLDEANRALLATHEELEARKRELEQLNITKNQFLGMAAHDLRNPLDVVRGYAELLAEDVSDRLDEEELRMLHQIRASSNYMLALVNDLLDVTKIESGTLELRCQPTDPVRFVSDNLSTQRLFAERKKIELIFDAEPDLPLVNLDPSKADQVLNNLIGNALKFSPLGSRVTVSVRRLASPEPGPVGEWVEIAVQDSGPGIPPEELENIFKPFRSAGTRTTGGESSSGLGLAIVHRIVECHGGKITVENAPQGGSRFRVVLPAAEEPKEGSQ